MCSNAVLRLRVELSANLCPPGSHTVLSGCVTFSARILLGGVLKRSPISFSTAAQNTSGFTHDTRCSSGQSLTGSPVRSASQRKSPCSHHNVYRRFTEAWDDCRDFTLHICLYHLYLQGERGEGHNTAATSTGIGQLLLKGCNFSKTLEPEVRL